MKHMLARTLFASALGAAAIAGVGCYSDEPPPQYAGEDPGNGDLVEVEPGVEVVADNDEGIFFSDDYYWVNRGGLWWYSTWYGGGWVHAPHVPDRIMGIHDPGHFAHYRPAGWEHHDAVRGGYATHAQYHTAHVSSGVHVRAAPVGGHGGGHGRR